MEAIKHPLIKGLNKVSPDLFATLVTNGVRDFTHITLDGDMPSDWWCINADNVKDTSNKFQTTLQTGNAKFNASLLTTPNIRIMKYGSNHLMTNTDTQIGQNPYSYKAFDYEPRLGLTTSMDIVTILNILGNATFAQAGGVKVLNVDSVAQDQLESMCLMFGLQYLRDQKILGERITYNEPMNEAKLRAGSLHPSKLAVVAAPGVKYLYIGVPNARQGSSQDMFNGSNAYAGVNGLEWIERYNQILPKSLQNIRTGFGVTAPQAMTTAAFGQNETFWFAIPVMSDDSSWQRVWLCECTTASSGNAFEGIGRVWHFGYNDSRYSTSAETTCYRMIRDATASLASIGPLKNIDGTDTTAADLQKSFTGVANPFQQVYTPLMGALGDLQFITESEVFTKVTESIEFDDHPDVTFKFHEIKFSYKRLGIRFTKAWYEAYYTTGFGVYTPRASNIQANTLATWAKDDINMLGCVSYSSPINIDGSLIDQLQLRQTYKRNKERACETDDFDKQYMAPNMTWGQARQVLNSATKRATFYAPVFGSLSTGASITAEPVTVEFGRDTTDGPITVKVTIGDKVQEPKVLLTEEARNYYLELYGQQATITLRNWDPVLTQEEVGAATEAKHEISEINKYASYDRRFIGMNMMLVYQFPWEALSVGGYPAVKEMPRQNAIMATVQSVCQYERFGKQLQVLWSKLSAQALLLKIAST